MKDWLIRVFIMCFSDGQFGLWLKSDMETGYSTPCPTFDNECLSSKSQFQCIEMEVWGFSI